MPASVSVIVTILNEARHLQDLLETLLIQEPPFEVLVVDAGSTDGSQGIVRSFARENDKVRLIESPGTRGAGRNRGAREATGTYLAFVDGDCMANPFWLQRMRTVATPESVVAGRTVLFGYWAFERLQRVELAHRGQDVTVPSSNLVYPRQAFLDMGGFDERFITAEDIDLNVRAVEAGLRIVRARDAIVYHRARDSVAGFLKQAFWNGYGRKQLTLKHGQLWHEYSFRKMLRNEWHLWGILRMAWATLGYLRCKVAERPRSWRRSSAAQAPAEARA